MFSKDKKYQFRTTDKFLEMLENLKQRFGVSSSAKVLETLVAREIEQSTDYFQKSDEKIHISNVDKFEAIIYKLEKNQPLSQAELILIIEKLSNYWGNDKKYKYNQAYFLQLLKDYLNLIQQENLPFAHFAYLIVGEVEAETYRDFIEFYESSKEMPINSSVYVSQYVECFLMYASNYFRNIDFNKYFNKTNLLTLAKFIYFKDISPGWFGKTEFMKEASKKIEKLDEEITNKGCKFEDEYIKIEYQLSGMYPPQLYFILELKENKLSFYLSFNKWSEFLNSLVIDKKGLHFYSKEPSGMFYVISEKHVRIDSAQMALDVDVPRLKRTIDLFERSIAYYELTHEYINIVGDI